MLLMLNSWTLILQMVRSNAALKSQSDDLFVAIHIQKEKEAPLGVTYRLNAVKPIYSVESDNML